MEAVTLPRRELTVLIVATAAASRLVEGPLAWLVTGGVFLAAALGAYHVLAPPPARQPIVRLVPLVLPALAAGGGAAAIHVIGFDGWLLLALAALAILVDRTLALEATLLGQPAVPARLPAPPARGADLAEVLGLELIVAFVAFVGVAALVPDALVEPASSPGSVATQIPLGWLLALALGDAAVAALVGLRLSSARAADIRDVTWSAGTYAAIAGIAAAALRALAMPRLIGPALLTLLLYLWSAYRGSTRATRRSARWLWESALLALLAIVVVAWNIAVRS